MTEGKTNKVVGRFCGKKSAFAVTVSEQFVRVHLRSDSGIEEKGFQARYFVLKSFKDPGKYRHWKKGAISFLPMIIFSSSACELRICSSWKGYQVTNAWNNDLFTNIRPALHANSSRHMYPLGTYFSLRQDK